MDDRRRPWPLRASKRRAGHAECVPGHDFAVIGGGILGLATARELLQRQPGLRIVVLEKEERIALHQTGHNSGVIHSGIYYKPGSAKARLSVSGARAMVEYCAARGVPHERVGKLIVAVRPSEVPSIAELERRAAANGVAGVVRVDGDAMRSIEPHVRGLAALHVGSVTVVDFAAVARALADDIARSGGEVRVRAGVRAIRERSDGVTLTTAAGPVECGHVIACAGLGSDDIARQVSAVGGMRIVPFRGDFYRLPPDRTHLVRGLIYPVPDPRFPFLGVHLTRRVDGEVWLGPNAVLAFGRGAYRRTDFELGDSIATLRYGGFWRMALRYWRTGATELVRDYSKRLFLAALRAYVPELQLEDLRPAPAGIRAQAVSADGTLVDDFWFEARPRVLLVRNAPSPAATASFALAREIVDRALAGSA